MTPACLIEAKLVDARGSGFAEGWDAHLMAPLQRVQGREHLDALMHRWPLLAVLAASPGHYRPHCRI